VSSFSRTTANAMVSPVVTHLHLLRHGRVDVGPRRLCYGWSDVPLSEVGRAEADRLLTYARTHLPRPDGVLSSDLRRCLDLAEPLAEALEVPLIVTDALREQHMGSWEGVAWDDLQARHDTAVNDYWDDYLNARPPGGESYADAADRVARWWHAEHATLEGRRWFLVGHVGAIRALCCHLLGVPTSEALRFAPAHGSHSHLLHAEAGTVMQTFGEVPGGSAGAEQYTAGSVDRADVRRIALSGSAGTGKSTLGRRLAAALGVPFIEEGMRKRLEAGLDVHSMSAEEHRDVLDELWEEQIALEDEATRTAGGFIADRSSVDFAAFGLLFHSHMNAWCEERIPRWLEAAARYDRVLLLPWGVLPLQADGLRSTNRWFQRRFQATVEGLLDRELDPGKLWRMPGLTELDARFDWVLQRVRRGRDHSLSSG